MLLQPLSGHRLAAVRAETQEPTAVGLMQGQVVHQNLLVAGVEDRGRGSRLEWLGNAEPFSGFIHNVHICMQYMCTLRHKSPKVTLIYYLLEITYACGRFYLIESTVNVLP